MFGVPIEYLMFGGIGFCLAWLTALMVLPAVHNRAIRLARERYDDLPLSIQEIRAEKDTIRAGFAAATRELELRIDKLREKTVAHATDVAKKNQLVDRLKQEVATVSAALRDSETREQAARDALREAKRGFADKDVTLGTAEGEIAVLKRDIAAKDAKLRAMENEFATMRSELADKTFALATAEKDIASISANLRESVRREEAARDDLREVQRGATDKNAILGVAESEVAALSRELAVRDAALRAAERNLAAVRSELANKDTALTRAETEIAAIKTEIAALTTLLVQVGSNSRSQAERPVSAPRLVEVVPFVPAARPVAQQAEHEPDQPQVTPQPLALPVSRQAAAVPAAHPDNGRAPARAPIDLVAGPTRLIPPTIPQAPQPSSDSVGLAVTEISDAARRIDEQQPGQNQRLRSTYAPFVKGSS